jgi:methylisocitrate lyase
LIAIQKDSKAIIGAASEAFVKMNADVGTGDAFRKLLKSNKTLAAPGVFSPAVALLAQKKFKCAYFSGAGFSGLLGLPDLGVTTLSEVTAAVREITSVVSIPLIVDVDTGFGEAVNVSRTVSEMEWAGAAAIQIEDQVMPKRCGHLEGKELVEPEEMIKKIIAARRTRKTNLVIVARTDAAAVEGVNGAIERAKLYLKAGADVIFPEALETKKDFATFSKNVQAPLLANMTEFGKTPYMNLEEFEELGYKIVIFPVTLFRTAMYSVKMALDELSRYGTQKRLLSKMMTRSEFYELIDYRAFESLDKETLHEAKSLIKKTESRSRSV